MEKYDRRRRSSGYWRRCPEFGAKPRANSAKRGGKWRLVKAQATPILAVPLARSLPRRRKAIETRRQDLQATLERLRPRSADRWTIARPRRGCGRPRQACRDVNKADAASGVGAGRGERMIKRGVAQIASRVAGGKGMGYPPAQAADDVVDRQAGAQDLRPARAHGRRDRKSAARVGCEEASVLPALLDLEAASARWRRQNAK